LYDTDRSVIVIGSILEETVGMKASDNISKLIVDLEHQVVTVIEFNGGGRPFPVDTNDPTLKLTVRIGVGIGDVPFQRLSCREYRWKTAETKNYNAAEKSHRGWSRERKMFGCKNEEMDECGGGKGGGGGRRGG
jgi:hypothetical protein